MKDYRKIRNDHTFSYGNKFYLIDSPLKHSIAKQRIEIRTKGNNGFAVYFAGRRHAVSEVIELSKPSLFDLDVQKKLDILALAETLDNVSAAAKISGVSQDTIYRQKRILKEHGPDGLKRQLTKDHGHKNRADRSLEEAVIEFSFSNPHLGQSEVARQLFKLMKIDVSASGVRNIWFRNDKGIRKSRWRVRRRQPFIQGSSFNCVFSSGLVANYLPEITVCRHAQPSPRGFTRSKPVSR